jgi:hypothetical protein
VVVDVTSGLRLIFGVGFSRALTMRFGGGVSFTVAEGVRSMSDDGPAGLLLT